jgi:hypothetical protein
MFVWCEVRLFPLALIRVWTFCVIANPQQVFPCAKVPPESQASARSPVTASRQKGAEVLNVLPGYGKSTSVTEFGSPPQEKPVSKRTADSFHRDQCKNLRHFGNLNFASRPLVTVLLCRCSSGPSATNIHHNTRAGQRACAQAGSWWKSRRFELAPARRTPPDVAGVRSRYGRSSQVRAIPDYRSHQTTLQAHSVVVNFGGL